MSEFNDYFKDEFFIIDSNNIGHITDKMYGFMLDDDKIIKNDNLNEINKITYDGTYIYIKSDENTIYIYQDFGGNYGLYLYNDENYFALSNSFLKLVEHLKNDHYLTLNEDYANYSITASMCTATYRDTLVNEIEAIPHNRKIIINKKNKTINVARIEYKRHSVDLDSEEGLEILDNWYYKWINIIRFLKKKTNNMQFDFSGGYDSRIVIALLLGANIDLNKVSIMSFNDDEICHDEDFEIASKIANDFNFKLNNKVISAEKVEFKDINTPITISFYTKLGFSNQLAYQFYRTKEPVFRFTGFAGETIRDNNFGTPFGYLRQCENVAKQYDSSFQYPTKRIIKSTYKKLSAEYNIPEDLNTMNGSYLFINSISRNHYCKFAAERYFSNELMIIPCFDKNLHRLKLNTSECSDENLLMALIFVRYCPKLLDYEFERNRGINEDTIEYAKKINKIKPFLQKEYTYISGPKIDKIMAEKYYKTKNNIFSWEEEGEYIKRKDIDTYLENIYKTKIFKKEFEKYFPEHMYHKILGTFQKNYFPLQHAYPVFATLKIIEDIKFSKYNNNPKLNDWLESYDESTKQNMNKIKRDIKKFKLFDEKYYLNQLTEEISVDPLTHYLETGYKEGKNPSKRFDGNYYLNKNKDVQKTGMNPLIHYVTCGFTEDRISKPVLEHCPINLRLLTKRKFDEVLNEQDTDDKWNFYLNLTEEIKKLNKIINVLEISPTICPIVEREDIMDIHKWDVENYPILLNKFISHDYYTLPYPIKNKEYDLTISSQGLRYIYSNAKMKRFFDEMERISKNLIIILPKKTYIYELNDNIIINNEKIKEWANGRNPISIKEFDEKIIHVYEFK